MLNDRTLTMSGNLVEDPRRKVVNTGVVVTNFRIASTSRRYDKTRDSWVDNDTLFVDVACWRALAENVARSLKKGDQVIVVGRLAEREYENREGEKRQRLQVDALAVGPDLCRAPAVLERRGRDEAPTPETAEPSPAVAFPAA